MIHWRQTVLALSANEAVRPYLTGRAPAWIFSRTGDRILWCNCAAAKRMGSGGFAAVTGRRYAETNILRRGLLRLRRHLRQAPGMARLKLPGSDLGEIELARCQAIDLADPAGHGKAILVVGPPMHERSYPPPTAEQEATDVAEFLAAADTIAGLVDAAGACRVAVTRNAAGEVVPVDLTAISDRPEWREFAVRLGEGANGWRLILIPSQPASPDLVIDRAAEPDTAVADRGAADAESPAGAGASIGSNGPADPKMPAVGREGPVAPVAGEAEPTRLDLGSGQPAPDRLVSPGRIGTETDTLRLRRALIESTRPGDTDAGGGQTEARSGPLKSGPVDDQSDLPAEAASGSREPVRFLWQTDAAHRILFVSPGLAQVVGRAAEVVGEIWSDAAARLRLDPQNKVAQALVRHDTWSGFTVWWPVETEEVIVPAELTALPVFSIDQSFQGFRGFGVLKPAEAITAAEFEARFGSELGQREAGGADQSTTQSAKVVPLHGASDSPPPIGRLTRQEHTAFEKIAADLAKHVNAPPRQSPEAPAPAEPPDRPLEGPADDRPAAAEPPPTSPTPPAVREAGPGGNQRVSGSDAPFVGQTAAEPADLQVRIRELTAILNTATDGVLVVDGDGRVEDLNTSAQALFGIEADAARGRSFTDLLMPESWQTALDYLSGLRGSGVASVLNEGREVFGKCGEGTIPLFMTMGRIGDAGAGRFCAVLRDITQWKHAEADLVSARKRAEEASSQKSDFLARVSHEIRTPLNAIIGFADVMIDERFGALGNSRYREYLRDIRTSGQHVVSLVNDLLDISKIEAGKIDLNFTAVQLNELVRECMALMQPQAGKGRVVLRSSLVSDIPAIVADQKSLRQIILNLLSNSVKFTRPGGQVIASTSLTEGGEAELRIRDSGEGMAAEELARAMEPFRQLSTASIGDQTGTGLGLPLTKALVEANRALFAIESAPGEGTIVKVTFPPTRVLSE